MNRKRKTSSKQTKPKQNQDNRRSSFHADAGELWIDPDLNRKITGPGGNRGEHTTSAVRLLKLADIALNKGA